MTNTLEIFRRQHGLTYRELASALGLSLNLTYRRCHLEALPVGDAIRSAHHLGVPLQTLWPETKSLARLLGQELEDKTTASGKEQKEGANMLSPEVSSV